jgi:hypothetical protein
MPHKFKWSCLIVYLLILAAVPFLTAQDIKTNSSLGTTHRASSKAPYTVTPSFEDHDLLLTAYQVTLDKQLIKKQEIRITSWLNKAKVRREDLFNDGREFFFIEFEGNTGTGVMQTLLAVYGWKGLKLVPVLLEPLSYKCTSGEDSTNLTIYYKIMHDAPHRTAVKFSYVLSEMRSGIEAKIKWDDILKWDDSTFSFRAALISDEISSEEKTVRNRITAARIKIAGSLRSISNIDLDLLQEFGLLGFLCSAERQ